MNYSAYIHRHMRSEPVTLCTEWLLTFIPPCACVGHFQYTASSSSSREPAPSAHFIGLPAGRPWLNVAVQWRYTLMSVAQSLNTDRYFLCCPLTIWRISSTNSSQWVWSQRLAATKLNNTWWRQVMVWWIWRNNKTDWRSPGRQTMPAVGAFVSGSTDSGSLFPSSPLVATYSYRKTTKAVWQSTEITGWLEWLLFSCIKLKQ